VSVIAIVYNITGFLWRMISVKVDSNNMDMPRSLRSRVIKNSIQDTKKGIRCPMKVDTCRPAMTLGRSADRLCHPAMHPSMHAEQGFVAGPAVLVQFIFTKAPSIPLCRAHSDDGS
jgi:hypothetical protein